MTPNERRAEWADLALTGFQQWSGIGDRDDALCDLLADLMHLADHEGFDFLEILDRATDHYIAEVQEEEGRMTSLRITLNEGTNAEFRDLLSRFIEAEEEEGPVDPDPAFCDFTADDYARSLANMIATADIKEEEA